MRTKSVFIIVLYFFALIGPSLLAFSLQPRGENGFIAEIGMLAGMTGLMIVFFQFVLSARIKWVDRLYGYNNIIDFHRRMGLVAFGFHDLLAVSILILMFIHSFFAGGDLKMFPLQVIWFILPPVGIALFIWQRFFLFKFAPEYSVSDVIIIFMAGISSDWRMFSKETHENHETEF